MLYVEVMYHFNEQVNFKISSKLIQVSKGLMTDEGSVSDNWPLGSNIEKYNKDNWL